MHELQSAYTALVASPLQHALFAQTAGPAQLLAQIRRLWALPDWDDGRLMQALEHMNRGAHLPASALLSGGWLPHRYDARTRSIHWCLPDGAATEPFHDEYIGRCLQRKLLNQFIRPRTPLGAVNAGLVAGRAAQRPAGFIFHLSRCGSTLVSGCLSELDSTMVLSEPPVLTELLLDSTLGNEDKRQAIGHLISVIATTVPGRQDLVIKWNAWDLFQWKLLQGLYPDVPAVLVVRDPVEILASHHRLPGRHMSGDPSLAGAAAVFDPAIPQPPFVSMLDQRIRVLHALMDCMRTLHDLHGIPVLDYAQLGPDAMGRIAHGFGLAADAAARVRVATRLRRHAKALDQEFMPDGWSKSAVFHFRDHHLIQTRLGGLYAQLLARTQAIGGQEALHAA